MQLLQETNQRAAAWLLGQRGGSSGWQSEVHEAECTSGRNAAKAINSRGGQRPPEARDRASRTHHASEGHRYHEHGGAQPNHPRIVHRTALEDGGGRTAHELPCTLNLRPQAACVEWTAWDCATRQEGGQGSQGPDIGGGESSGEHGGHAGEVTPLKGRKAGETVKTAHRSRRRRATGTDRCYEMVQGRRRKRNCRWTELDG